MLSQSFKTPPMSVEALVGYGRNPHIGIAGKLSNHDKQIVHSALARCGIERFAHHDISQLSGGERQRAFIAMTLAQDTTLMVLDEPTTYLDINACHDVMRLIRDINQNENKTIALVIHDIDLALRYADYLVVMQNGHVIQQGSTQEVLALHAIETAFAMDVYMHQRTNARNECEHGFVLYPQ